jgi:hypothetical protein
VGCSFGMQEACGLGTYGVIGTEALRLTAVSANSGLAFTTVIHAWVFVTDIVLRTGLLGAKGLSITQFKNRLARERSVENRH